MLSKIITGIKFAILIKFETILKLYLLFTYQSDHKKLNIVIYPFTRYGI